jgi:hypothetical protein
MSSSLRSSAYLCDLCAKTLSNLEIAEHTQRTAEKRFGTCYDKLQATPTYSLKPSKRKFLTLIWKLPDCVAVKSTTS